MNNTLKIWVLCCLTLCLCSGTLQAGKLVFFVNGGMAGGWSESPLSYNSGIDEFFYTIEDSGKIDTKLKSGIAFSGGVTYYITPNFGLSFSVGHSKRDIRLDAQYQTRAAAYTGAEIMNESVSWEDTGELTVTPLNFNVTQKFRLMKNLSVNIFGGLSVMLYKINLPSHMGYSAVSVSYYPDENLFVYYPDHFDLPVSIKHESSYRIGFNVGLELEQKLTSWFGVSGGFHYYKAAKKEFRWELNRQMSFDGKLGNLVLGGVPSIFYGDQVVTELDLSYFQAYLGVKFYM